MSVLCPSLHQLFRRLPRFGFPFDVSKIPLNGVYILFEKGQQAHGGDRIVRVGTHTGVNQLRSRLNQHFVQENKDRSIFRKNIGRALLNKSQNGFLDFWELDLTTRAAKDKYAAVVNRDVQASIERSVTEYIQKYFSFVVLCVDNKDERMKLESKIISTVSLCRECCPSDSWLGCHSPKEKIRESGLWIVNELYKEPLNQREFDNLHVQLKSMITAQAPP